MEEMEGSPRFALNKQDAISIARGAGIATLAALVTYIAETIPSVDFGQYTPVVMALASIAINGVRRWIADNQ